MKEPRNTDMHKKIGVAVDLGSTTIAVCCLDMVTKNEILSFSFANPQHIYGADVITRIKHCVDNPSMINKMHLLVDIGGGTTDIAFFTITEDLTPNIHIVKSFHKGLNFVFEQFCKENPQFSIIEAQELFWDDPHEFRRYTSMYTEELNKQLNEVIEIVKREFMYKVGKYGKKMSALTFAMNGCPTVYCGGGSTFHRMRISPRYFSDVRMVGKDTLSIPNIKNRTIPNELYTILATSYGLSVPQIEDPQMIDLDKLFEQIGLNYSEGKQKQIPRMDYGLLDD